MSIITFHGETGLARITMERGTELKIAGGAVSAGGPMLAHLQNGAWHLGLQRFESITCKGPVTVEFAAQDGVRKFGPFAELAISAGLVTTPKCVLARYHPVDDAWHFDQFSSVETFVLRDAVA